MKIPFAFQPHLCAGSGCTKFAPSTFRVREAGDRVFVDVTDGRMAITVPVTLDPGEKPGGIYPASILAHARAYAREIFEDQDEFPFLDEREPKDYWVQLESDRVAFFEREDGTKVVAVAPADTFFPDVHVCVPTGDPEFALSLNARLLRLLAEALGDCSGIMGVELQWFGAGKPMRVRIANQDGGDGVALLMPMRCDP